MTARRVLIVGCGYIGLALATVLRQSGLLVWGLRRSAASADELRASGAVPLIADITEPRTLDAVPPADWVVLCQSPGRASERYRAVRVDGTRHVLARMQAYAPQRVLLVSSTGVYGQSGGEWVDEDTPPEPADESGRALLEAEQLALGHPAGLVLRLGGIYGPGRSRITQLPAEPTDRYINLIRKEDAVGAIARCLHDGRVGRRYLGVDDEPVTRATLAQWIADRTGRPTPAAVATSPPGGKRCQNARLKALGYRFRFPTFREGLADLLP